MNLIRSFSGSLMTLAMLAAATTAGCGGSTGGTSGSSGGMASNGLLSVTSNPATAKDFVIDDLGVGTNGACRWPETLTGALWGFYSDAANGGKSVVEFDALLKGSTAAGGIAGPCVTPWRGKVDGSIPNPFAGLMINHGTYLKEASRYAGIAITLRGDGKYYRLKVPLSVQEAQTPKELDAYGAMLNCGNNDGKWYDYQFSWEKMTQEGWGKRRDFDLLDLNRILLETAFKSPEGGAIDFSCDVGEVRLFARP